MAASLTYNSLVTDVQGYAERTDDAFVAQIPRFIMLAENRVIAEARGLGLIKSVQDVMVTGVNGSALALPARWRETASISIGTGSGFNSRKALKLRSYEYCRAYWPNPTLTEEPEFYADWEWGWMLIAPSPALAHPYELIFFEKPVPLDSSNQTNWTAANAPQLILNATLLEASAWVKNKDLIATWQVAYDRALKQVDLDSKRRLFDRTAVNPTP